MAAEEMNQIKDELAGVKERVGKLQNLAWVLGGLAVALGLGGANLSGRLGDIRAEATILKESVEAYRKDAKAALEDLERATDPIVTAVTQRGTEAIREARDEALAQLERTQGKIEIGDWCARLSQLQFCWGAAEVSRDAAAVHTAAFSFEFERPFRGRPTITNGINVAGSGHALGVYKWKATTSKYEGRLNNMYIKDPIVGRITMQYLAVGMAQ